MLPFYVPLSRWTQVQPLLGQHNKAQYIYLTEWSSPDNTSDKNVVSPEISKSLWVTSKTMFPQLAWEGVPVQWLCAKVFQQRMGRWDTNLHNTSIPSYDSTLIYMISCKHTMNRHHRHIHYYNMAFIHLSICNTIINHSLNTTFMHLTKLLKIHTYTQHVTWKPIREKNTRCSSSRIGMRKLMHLFVYAQICILCSRHSLLSLHTFPPSHAIWSSLFLPLLYSY